MAVDPVVDKYFSASTSLLVAVFMLKSPIFSWFEETITMSPWHLSQTGQYACVLARRYTSRVGRFHVIIVVWLPTAVS